MGSIVTGALLIAYGLYTFTAEGLPTNHSMMLTIPFVLYGIFRYLYLVNVKKEGGSPEEVLLRDVPIMLTAIGWVTTAGVILSSRGRSVGAEAQCGVTFSKQTSTGKALLETNEIIFRGDFRLKIDLKSITALDAKAGKLKVDLARRHRDVRSRRQGRAWADKIRNPKGLLDKLGVKAGQRIVVLARTGRRVRRQNCAQPAPPSRRER